MQASYFLNSARHVQQHLSQTSLNAAMPTPTDYMFHSAAYQMFQSVATVLERFVACAPRTVCLERLVSDMAIGVLEIRKICSLSCEKGLIVAVDDTDHWVLACHPGDISLEDVLVIAMLSAKPVRNDVRSIQMRKPPSDVDLLIGQAFLAIDQSINSHLRKFQLDRVSTSRCGFLQLNRRALLADL